MSEGLRSTEFEPISAISTASGGATTPLSAPECTDSATIIVAEMPGAPTATKPLVPTKGQKKKAKYPVATGNIFELREAEATSYASAADPSSNAKLGQRTVRATLATVRKNAEKTIAESQAAVQALHALESKLATKCNEIQTTLMEGETRLFAAGDQINTLLAETNPSTGKTFTVRVVARLLGRWTASYIAKLSVVSRATDSSMRDAASAAGATWNDVYEVCRMRRRYGLEEPFEVTMALFLGEKGKDHRSREKDDNDPVDAFGPDECVGHVMDYKRGMKPSESLLSEKPFDPKEHARDSRSLIEAISSAFKDKGNKNYFSIIVLPDAGTGNLRSKFLCEAESAELRESLIAGALIQLLEAMPVEEFEAIKKKTSEIIREVARAKVDADAAARVAGKEPEQVVDRLQQTWRGNVEAAEKFLSQVLERRRAARDAKLNGAPVSGAVVQTLQPQAVSK